MEHSSGEKQDKIAPVARVESGSLVAEKIVFTQDEYQLAQLG